MRLLRLFFLLFSGALVSIAIGQTVHQVAAGDSTLYEAYSAADSGDIIELISDGGLYTNPPIFINMDIAIRAASGLEVRPILRNNTDGDSDYIFRIPGKAMLILRGLDLDGDGTGDGASSIAKYIIRIETDDSLSAVKVKIDDCRLHDTSDKLIKPYGQTGVDSLLVRNTTFYNSAKEGVVLYSGSTADPAVYMVYASFYNCTFYSTVREAIKGDTNPDTKVVIDHCTFYDIGGPDKPFIYFDDTKDVLIKNCVFQKNLETGNHIRLESDENIVSRCVIWDVNDWDIDNSSFIFDTLQANPLFANAANADFTLQAGSPAFNWADDGSSAGDLRWAANAPADAFFLTVNVVGPGAVTTVPDVDLFAPDTKVILTATPENENFILKGWIGDLSGNASPDSLVMDGHKKVTAVFGLPVFTIAEVKYDGNYDFKPDMLGDTVLVYGTVTSPSFSGTLSTDYTIQDATAGISLFKDSDYKALANGDSISVVGVVSQTKGLTQIVPLDLDSVKVISSGHEYDSRNSSLASIGESTESYVLNFRYAWLIDADEWPAAGNDAEVRVTNGMDTLVMFIDSDTDIDDNAAPSTWFSLTALGDQMTESIPANNGYFMKPRYYSDITLLRAPGKLRIAAGQDNLDNALAYDALPNDTLELITDGGDYPNSSYLVVDIPLTVQAAPGLTEKPRIYHNNPETSTILLFEIKTGGSLNLRGVELDGLAGTATSAKYLLRTDNDPMSMSYSLKVYDCYLHDVVFGSDGNFLRAYIGTYADTVIFDNCVFSNSGKEGVRMKDAENLVGYIEFNNCTFSVTNKEAIYIWGADPIARMNHCTFDSCGYNGARSIRFRAVEDAQIKNVICTNNAGDSDQNRALTLYGTSSIDYSDFFEAGAITGGTVGTHMMNVDPLYADRINLDFTLDATSPVLGQADDGDAMGDLRWDPNYTDISDDELGLPVKYELSQNYPNPFNPVTTIEFNLIKAGQTKLTVYNVKGQKVAELVNRMMQAGSHQFKFRAESFASGIYFYRIESGNFSVVKKMILLK